MRFLRAAVIDDGFWLIPLTKIERLVYFYLSSKCQSRWGVSEAEIARVLQCDLKRIRAALVTLEDILLIRRWRFPRPKCHEYQVTITSDNMWGIGGKRTSIIRGKRTYLTGADAPIDGVQTLPPPTTTSPKFDHGSDTILLALCERHMRQFHFSRRPIGDRGVITNKHRSQMLEMMRTLVGHGFHTDSQFVELLEGGIEYMKNDKDWLSTDGRDHRERIQG